MRRLSGFKDLEKQGSADALANLAMFYKRGKGGLEQNWTTALELFQKAADIGSVMAYKQIIDYQHGRWQEDPQVSPLEKGIGELNLNAGSDDCEMKGEDL